MPIDQVLPLRARVDLGEMTIRGTLYSPKLHYWNFTIRLFRVIFRTPVGEVLPLYRDEVGVFISPSRLTYRTLVGGVLHLRRDAVSEFCSPSRLGHRTLVAGVLPLCRDAFSKFCNHSKLCYRNLTLLQRYSRWILLPQVNGPQDTRRVKGLTLLQRCSQCILQPQPTGSAFFGDDYAVLL